MSGLDSGSFTLELEDSESKSLADKKAVRSILICVAISIALFLSLYLTGDYTVKEINSIRRTDKKQKYPVEVEFEYGKEHLELSEELSVLPEGYADEYISNEQPENFLSSFAKKLIKEISNSNENDLIILPKEKDGVYITWRSPVDEVPYWVFVVCLFLCLVFYFTRYDSIKHEAERKRKEFADELPNMIMQYILMLNAGLISEMAFEELVVRNKGSENYLYRCFSYLIEQSKQMNTSFISEMYNFSCKFGNKEFLRFATMCVEHSHRGSELAEKLDAERSNAWNSKLSIAKGRAKEAETKLCFPLMLLLIALVIICITPAIIEI